MAGITRGSPHVLCVDDDPHIVELTATFVEREYESITITTETSAEAALEVLEEESIDCIVSDYDMPEMDGLEFLGAVREFDPDLPFILFTGKGSEVIASEAISAGVTDYLQKQLGEDQYVVLANRIQNGIEQYRTQQRLERNELLFEALFHDPSAVVGILDPSGILVQANRTAMELMDATRNDVEGCPFWDLPWWDHSAETREEVKVAIDHATDGEYVDLETEHVGPEGQRFTVVSTVKPVFDGDEIFAIVADGRLPE